MGAAVQKQHNAVTIRKRTVCSCGDVDCILVEIPRISDHWVYIDKIQKNGQLVVAKREPCFCELTVNHWGDTT